MTTTATATAPAAPVAATAGEDAERSTLTLPSGRRGRRWLGRAPIALVAAVLALLLGVSTASADQFSVPIPPQQWSGYFGGCTITAGPVFDPYSHAGRFAIIGGAAMSCSVRRTYQVTVQEFLGTTRNGTYYQRGTTGSFAATGYGYTGIVETGRACGTGWWFTQVTIRVSGYTGLVFKSNPAQTTALGYSATVC